MAASVALDLAFHHHQDTVAVHTASVLMQYIFTSAVVICVATSILCDGQFRDCGAYGYVFMIMPVVNLIFAVCYAANHTRLNTDKDEDGLRHLVILTSAHMLLLSALVVLFVFTLDIDETVQRHVTLPPRYEESESDAAVVEIVATASPLSGEVIPMSDPPSYDNISFDDVSLPSALSPGV